jgi:hypothetical protein
MSSIGEKELEEIYVFAIQLGKDAGKLLLDAASLRMQGDGRKEQTSVEKASSVDLVTQTDEGKLDICDISCSIVLLFRSCSELRSLQMSKLLSNVKSLQNIHLTS